jgi:pimeloyl-ACP methyl ester carboxylesterase
MGKITANDATFYYETVGTGYPLLLISGYSRDHTQWDVLLPSLSSHFRVITFDNRGTGQTKDEGKPITVELFVRDIYALIQALHLTKPYIMGQSMGGSMALMMAAMYPDAIGALGLLTASARWRKAQYAALKGNLTLRQKGVPPELIFKSTYPWFFGEQFLSNPINIQTEWEVLSKNPYPQSVEDQSRQLAAFEQFDGRDCLKKIQVPTCVMYGKEDLMVPAVDSEFLVKQILHSKGFAFEGAHGLIVETTTELSDVIIQFFTTLS